MNNNNLLQIYHDDYCKLLNFLFVEKSCLPRFPDHDKDLNQQILVKLPQDLRLYFALYVKRFHFLKNGRKKILNFAPFYHCKKESCYNYI